MITDVIEELAENGNVEMLNYFLTFDNNYRGGFIDLFDLARHNADHHLCFHSKITLCKGLYEHVTSNNQ